MVVLHEGSGYGGGGGAEGQEIRETGKFLEAAMSLQLWREQRLFREDF